MTDKNLKINRKFFNFALTFCILIFSFFIFAVNTANAATLYLSPSSGNFSVGNIFTVNVLVNTENADINNAEATINFPSGLLEVISISKSGSIFSLWVEEPTFSNSAGTLSLNGGLPTPGFKGSGGKVIGAVFRVKKAGSASLVFSSAAVRANDGYGTDVFRTGTQASFNLIGEERPAPPKKEISPEKILEALQISSSTHPDQDKWYPGNDPVFKWDLPSGVSEVILVLSKRANSLPIIKYSPPISEKALTDLEDGIWYLNGRFRTSVGLGTVASFKFNIDTQPPRDFSVVRLDTNDSTNPRPELLFESSDATSGIDRYEMKIGEGDWFTIAAEAGGKPYRMPSQGPGTKEVAVKAFDRAGNTTTTTTTTTTDSIEPPTVDPIVPPKIKYDTPLIIRGLAKPERKVLVFVSSPNVISLETVADSAGRWTAEYEQPLPKGKHQVHARAVDKREAISDPSNYVAFEVVSDPIFDRLLDLFDKILNIFSRGGLFIAFLAALVGLILALIELLKTKAGRWFKFLADLIAVKRAQKKSDKQIDHIIKDMEQEIKFLHSISKRRRLGPEENYLKTKMAQYLKTLKSIRDLEDKR